MVTAVKDLRIYQLGVESTRGTAVATTTRWVGGLEIIPQEPVFQPEVQLGVLVSDGATTDIIAQRHADVRLEADLTFEQILHVGMMSMKGAVTPTGAGADRTWVFNPTYLADPALNAFTLHRRLTNGTTNWDERIAYLMARSFSISGNIGENTKLEVDCFGRPVETGATLTAAIAIPTVNFVPVSLWKLYVDDTAGGIGGTQLSCNVVSFDFDFETMAQPKFYVTGQADKSFCDHGLKRARWGLSIVTEINAAIIAEQAKAASRAIRYVRLQAVGAALGGSNYSITIDAPFRYAMGMFDQAGDRDGNDTATLDLIPAYDSSTPLGAKLTVVNALTALP
jgi:hypothetical protein